jgi:hypothetical protein
MTPFVSLEATRELAVRAAHDRIVALAGELDGGSAAELRVLVGIINDAEELEIKKFVITQRTSGAEPRPDPARALAIATEEPAR